MKPRLRWLAIALLFVAVFAAVVIIWKIVGYSVVQAYGGLDEAGQFGDSFGYVNSLFSGLALAGVVVAIFLQMQELAFQRQELTESRIAQQGSQQALNLAAFLSAATAIVTTDRDELSAAQRKTYDRMLELLPQLDERLKDIVDASNTPPLPEYVARRLEEALRSFRDKTKPVIGQKNNASVNVIRQAAPSLQARIHAAASDVPPSLRPSIEGINHNIGILIAFELPAVQARDEEYVRYWGYYQTVVSSIEKLAIRCRGRQA